MGRDASVESESDDPSAAAEESDIAATRSVRRGPGTYDRTLSAEERREEQREALLSAAAKVFARDGYASASVASILEVSGLSRGTFYRHFKDLHDVFLAVEELAARTLVERIEEAYTRGSDPMARMQACIETYLRTVHEQADLARVFHREARVSGEKHTQLRRRNIDRMLDLFKEGLALSVADGTLEKVPDDMVINACIFAIEGVALRYLEEHREAQAIEAAGALYRLCARALR